MKMAPNLTSLSLNLNLPADGINEYKSMVSTFSFPNIKELRLQAVWGDDFVISTLNAKTMLEKIEVSGDEKGDISRPIIVNHSESIRDLNLEYSFHTTGKMVQDILSGCPHLEVFKGRRINANDLVQFKPSSDGATFPTNNFIASKDWVCLKLKTLSLYFDMMMSSTNWRNSTQSQFQIQREMMQNHAFRQLSRLTDLESLDISGAGGVCSIESLDLSLQSRGGKLEQLATLCKLKRFQYSTLHRVTIGDEELQWMGLNWDEPKFSIN
jgi:hypothetical protein